MKNEDIEEVDYDKIEADPDHERLFLNVGFVLVVIILCIVAWSLCSCTISFTNISTHGTANDLGDEDIQTDPNISPDISVPVSGI